MLGSLGRMGSVHEFQKVESSSGVLYIYISIYNDLCYISTDLSPRLGPEILILDHPCPEVFCTRRNSNRLVIFLGGSSIFIP